MDERVAALSAKYPKVGNLTADDLDDEMLGGIVRALALADLTDRYAHRRVNTGGWFPKWLDEWEARQLVDDVILRLHRSARAIRELRKRNR